MGELILIMGDNAINWKVKIRFEKGSTGPFIKQLDMISTKATESPTIDATKDSVSIQDQSTDLGF